jgi:MoxR-like ATPase
MSDTQQQIQRLAAFVSEHIIGQQTLINRLMIALLADGHLLVEGAPGLAKTRAVKVLSEGISGDFHRIQFTPDLLPADLTGTEVFRPQDGSFQFQKGPLFHHLILADEINRAPAKVQSALLEAMAERQITVGSVTYPLPRLFLVMATQNPIEQEGTYPLPEAQLDRFLMHLRIDYPDDNGERGILHLARREARSAAPPLKAPQELAQETLFQARDEVLDLHMAESLEEYLLSLVLATRRPGKLGRDLEQWVEYGASPRASIALDRCARAHAWLAGRDFVTPEDIQSVAPDVLRHRVILSYEAEAEGVTPDRLVQELIARIAVP